MRHHAVRSTLAEDEPAPLRGMAPALAGRAPGLKLDRLDLKILRALQENDAITYRDLSKRVALSASACVARVKQLESSGVITGYHAQVAVARVRPMVVMVAQISMASHVPDDLDRFDRLLWSTPEVVEVLRVNGAFDYFVRLTLPSIEDWHCLAKRLLMAEHKVEKMVTHVVMQEMKPFTGYPVPMK